MEGSSSDEDDSDCSDGNGDTQMQTSDSEAPAGRPLKQETTHRLVIVDEDGFQLVTKGRKDRGQPG
jgi:hypothetical protein